MAGREELDNGEFLILTDDSVHVVGEDSVQIQFTPATLYLTNNHIILDPHFNVEIVRKISLADVVRIAQTITNDCPVLDILCEESGQSIHVFIPDESHRLAFASILGQLRKHKEKSQKAGDRYAMNMRRSIQNSESLNSFYKAFNSAPDYDQAKVLAKKEKKIAKERKVREALNNVLIPFNFVSDFLDICPEFFFAAATFGAVLLSFLFKYISPGSFLAAIFFFIILYYGKLQVTKKMKKTEKISPEDANPSLKQFVMAINQFQDHLNSYIKWGNSRETLKMVIFFLILGLLFIFINPTILLITSLIGLAIIERWNPLGFGSLPSLLSRLILW